MGASIGGVALKAKLEGLLAELICIKNNCLCLGKSVTAVNVQLMVAYNWWIIINSCELTDDEINCIVNELRQTCNFSIPQKIAVTTPPAIIELPVVPYEPEPLIYTKACAYNFIEKMSFLFEDIFPRVLTYVVTNVKINGFEYVTAGSEPSYSFNMLGGYDGLGFPLGLNWVEASNIGRGKTYTDQVDKLQKILSDFGITDIKLQTMQNDAGLFEDLYDVPMSDPDYIPFGSPGYPSRKVLPFGAMYILRTDNVTSFEIRIAEDSGGDFRTYLIDGMAYEDANTNPSYEIRYFLSFHERHNWMTCVNAVGLPFNIEANAVVE